MLIPGADGRAWNWHRLTPELTKRGHDVVVVDLPVADPRAGFDEYAAAVMDAVGGRRADLVLVAQSLAGFIAPLVAERLPTSLIVLLNAMVPRPKETPGAWWEATGHAAARAEHYARKRWVLPAEFDPIEAFFQDVPAGVVRQAMAMGEPQVRFDTLFGQPWPLDSWPRVPTRFLQARDDRFFPVEFQRVIARERLGMAIDEMAGGHLVALSHPVELADRLLTYV